MRIKQYEYYRNFLFKKGIEEQNWPLKTIGEISSKIISGSGVTREQLGKGEHPAIRAGDINSFLPLSFTECISFVNEGEINNKKIFKYGDILMSNIGGEETVGIATAYLGEKEGFAGNGVNIIKHNQNPLYLSFALSSEFAREEIRKLAQKSTVYRLYPSTIKQIKIPVPSLEEQERIVEILDKLYMTTNELSKGSPSIFQSNLEQYNFYKELLLNLK